MRTGRGRLLTCGVVSALLSTQCAPRPDPPPEQPASDLQPILSVKELMEDIVDPVADGVFDAVAVDVGPKGLVETKPTSEEDWIKIKRAAATLAESSNLLKMPRRMAPAGDPSHDLQRGGPELTPAEIEAKVAKDRGRWNMQADALRDEALKVIALVQAKDSDGLFEAGSNIDRACENCHLEFWYPGDKAAVLRDQKSRAGYTR
jgi:hypothetical protein